LTNVAFSWKRQRLLIREANYLRGLVGLPPARAEKGREEATLGDAVGGRDGSGPAAARE
jgi:hypothetical protein